MPNPAIYRLLSFMIDYLLLMHNIYAKEKFKIKKTLKTSGINLGSCKNNFFVKFTLASADV